MSPTERLAPIDLLKAGSIMVVVAIHAVGGKPTPLGGLLLEIGRSAVPIFLAVSGFLYQRGSTRANAHVLRRLGRVLPPYLVASALAQLYHAFRGAPRSAKQVLLDLYYGSSFGPYYFVFLLVQMILVVPLLVRISRRAALGVLIFLVVGRLAAHVAGSLLHATGAVDMNLVLHDPTLWGGYFLAGYSVAAHHTELSSVSARRFGAIFAVTTSAAAVLLACTMTIPPVAGITGWLNTYVVSAVAALAASRVQTAPAVVASLSDATYAIYLHHLFFVLEVQRWLMPSLSAEPVAWCAGMGGPLLLVLGARRVLGPRSRTFVGA